MIFTYIRNKHYSFVLFLCNIYIQKNIFYHFRKLYLSILTYFTAKSTKKTKREEQRLFDYKPYITDLQTVYN